MDAEHYSPRPLTDGERWTAEALTALRRGGYTSAAWAAFVGSSLERSAAARRARPRMARQAGAWGAAGAGAWVLAHRASGRRTPLLRGLLWWLAVWRMLDWHLGMAEGGDGRVRERLATADAVTLARFLAGAGRGGRRARARRTAGADRRG